MEKIKLSCPFCGLVIDATQTADKDIIFTHALTGENIKMNFNNSINKFNLKRAWFKHRELVNTQQACEILDVTRMAVSKAVNNGLIKGICIDGHYLYTLESVLDYKKKREAE